MIARNLTRDTIVAAETEVAGGLLAKFRGLMARPSLAAGSALWLPDSNGIHMMFMRFAIDAVFLGRADEEGVRRVVAVRQGLRPWTGVVWYVRGAHGVLELPTGAVRASGTALGDAVTMSAAWTATA